MDHTEPPVGAVLIPDEASSDHRHLDNTRLNASRPREADVGEINYPFLFDVFNELG